MSLPKNNTHIHLTRTFARDAANDQGLDLDDLHFYRTGNPGLWGWMLQDEAEAILAADAAAEREANGTAVAFVNAPPLTGAIDVLEGDILPPETEPADFSGIIPDDPEGDDEETSDVPAIQAAAVSSDDDELSGLEDEDDIDMSMDAIMARNTERHAAIIPQPPIVPEGSTDDDGFYDAALDASGEGLAPRDQTMTPAMIEAEAATQAPSPEPDPEPAAAAPAEADPVALANKVRQALTAWRDAQPGDVILVLGGPMLPARAKLDAQAFAKKTGEVITIHDALTLDLLDEVVPRLRVVKSEDGKVERRVGPTETQEIIIRLCRQIGPDGKRGASGNELFAAGAGGNAKKGAIAWRQLAMACERYGYSFRVDSRVINDRAITLYALAPADADDQSAA